MTSFRLPACATWERGEGPGTLIWTWAKRGGYGPRGEDLGGAWQRVEHHQHARKDEPFNLYNSSPGPSTCTWRELETGPYNTAESGWGPHDWSVLSPMAVHRDKRTTSWHAGPYAGGLRGTGRGGTYVEAQHRAANGSRKWTGATRQERAEPHRQFTKIDDFIARATSTVGPRGRHQGRQHAKTILVLAWRYWTVCRSFRIDLSGRH